MWALYALAASFFWGATYVISELIYKKISVVTSLGVTLFFAAIFTLLAAAITGLLKPDLATIAQSSALRNLLIAQILVLTIAELMIGFSIATKNATLAGLIEVSYPIFIALFAYFLFKETALSLGTIIGGVLIFTGVGMVYFFHK